MRKPPSEASSFDPIALAAPIAWRSAPETCEVDPATGIRCDWYHRIWPYLRLLGVNDTLRRDAHLYLDALGPLARAGDSGRVLVSGAADHLFAAIVLKAYCNAGAALDLTVVDRCETPLLLSRWYADQVSGSLHAVRSGILEFRPETPFDVICAHSFIYHFAPAERPALIAAWHDALRPGGRVLALSNVRPKVPESSIGFPADAANRLRDRVLAAAARRKGELGIGEAELARALDAYIANFTLDHESPRSPDELTTLFSEGGFMIEQATITSPSPDSGAHAPSGSDTGSLKSWIIARRD